MRNLLNFLLSSALIVLTFSAPQTVYGSEPFSSLEEQKKPSAIQLQMVADDHLEAVLGTGYKTTTISSLPHELLKEIFLNLDTHDLNSITHVSKCFNRLAVEIFRIAPPVARGYEDIYQRFLKGVLIYRPRWDSDVGMIKLPIAALSKPLEGTFDLSQCGDKGQYLSIATGYRKRKKAENANKIEIWLAPRFLIEKDLQQGTASHFAPFMNSWKAKTAPIGVFFTWGGWDDLRCFDHAATSAPEILSSMDLYTLWNTPNITSQPYATHPTQFPLSAPPHMRNFMFAL